MDPEKGLPTTQRNDTYGSDIVAKPPPQAGPSDSPRDSNEKDSNEAGAWPFEYDRKDVLRAVDRFLGRNRPPISFVTSVKNIVFSSWINLLFIFLPIAWAAHFLSIREREGWNPLVTFILCFISIIPLERMFDWAGEQMGHYLGAGLGSLLIISLNNAVEATLAIILLLKCELKLVQSTVMGVILLHLLFIPGMSFLTDGAHIISQELDQDITEMNHTLLTMGILAFLLPAAFFAALDGREARVSAVTDVVRDQLLNISRGMAIVMIVVYIGSRIYLHNPPGDDNSLRVPENAPEAVKAKEKKLREDTPDSNVWTLIVTLVISVALMAVTAEFLVESIEFVREQGNITEEFFGLVILPAVSFSGDAALSVGQYVYVMWKRYFGGGRPIASIAKTRAIDLSIQFALFIMPFLILLAWWTRREFTLLFNTFEVAAMIGACFLVNYVTADKRTNWIEGLALIGFYVMIVLCAWYFQGETAIDTFNEACQATLAAIIASEGGTPTGGETAPAGE